MSQPLDQIIQNCIPVANAVLRDGQSPSIKASAESDRWTLLEGAAKLTGLSDEDYASSKRSLAVEDDDIEAAEEIALEARRFSQALVNRWYDQLRRVILKNTHAQIVLNERMMPLVPNFSRIFLSKLSEVTRRYGFKDTAPGEHILHLGCVQTINENDSEILALPDGVSIIAMEETYLATFHANAMNILDVREKAHKQPAIEKQIIQLCEAVMTSDATMEESIPSYALASARMATSTLGDVG